MTIAGILFKILSKRHFKYLTTTTYLVMGWLGFFLVIPLSQSPDFPFMGIVWLVLGGVLYTLGVVFFLWRSLPYNHAVWHFFVLAGTIAHFFCILFYVIM
jgi:hemolysin III